MHWLARLWFIASLGLTLAHPPAKLEKREDSPATTLEAD